MNIIGISCGYHDSACCLLQDGRVTAAAQEERFSRVKNDKSFPSTAFRYCLNYADLTMADLHCVAFYEDPCQKLSRQLWMGMLPGLAPDRRASIRSRAIGTYPQEEIRLVTGHDGPIEIVDHHLSHAASAYFFQALRKRRYSLSMASVNGRRPPTAREVALRSNVLAVSSSRIHSACFTARLPATWGSR